MSASQSLLRLPIGGNNGWQVPRPATKYPLERTNKMSSGDAERPPSTVAIAASATSAAALDSLLSPKGPLLTTPLLRDSVADSDYNDVALEDDPRFSTVALSEASERASIVSLKSEPLEVDELSDQRERRTTISSAPSRRVSFQRHFSHKKLASSVTAGDAARANILARLGPQKALDENDLDALRVAGAGQHRLHEEFVRLHKERRAEAAKSEEDAIDWGTGLSPFLTLHEVELTAD